MSNGDDVLDNWEEIDEAGLNSTVNKLKTSSETSKNSLLISSSTTDLSLSSKTTQMKLLQRSTNQGSSSSLSKPLPNSSPLDDMAATFQPVMMVLHKPHDEYQSANYTPPIANQTVKILRRPTQSSEPRNNGIRPKQPIKTLQQREQEYAEARLRILGSAKNPEDEEQRAASVTAIVSMTSTNSTPSTPVSTTPTTTTLSSTASINMTAATKTNSAKIQGAPNQQYNNLFNQQQQQKYQQNYQQQQQQQNYFYNQQQPQSPAYNNNNNRTFNMPPLLGLGPMGAIGQPAQYQATSPSSQTQQQQPQHLKYQQYHQKSPQQQHNQQQQQQQTWSPVVGGSVSSSSVRQQQMQQQQQDTILRLPRGPDGSTGFQVRR